VRALVRFSSWELQPLALLLIAAEVALGKHWAEAALALAALALRHNIAAVAFGRNTLDNIAVERTLDFGPRARAGSTQRYSSCWFFLAQPAEDVILDHFSSPLFHLRQWKCSFAK